MTATLSDSQHGLFVSGIIQSTKGSSNMQNHGKGRLSADCATRYRNRSTEDFRLGLIKPETLLRFPS